jgi:hypothetical protein
MVLGHAWAIRHWMFAGIMKSVEDYRKFLQPLVYSMLQTGTPIGLSKQDGLRTRGAEGQMVVTKG